MGWAVLLECGCMVLGEENTHNTMWKRYRGTKTMNFFHLTRILTSTIVSISSSHLFSRTESTRSSTSKWCYRMDSLFGLVPRPGLPPRATSCTLKPLPSTDSASVVAEPTFPMKALGPGLIVPTSMTSMTFGLPSEVAVVEVSVWLHLFTTNSTTSREIFRVSNGANPSGQF